MNSLIKVAVIDDGINEKYFKNLSVKQNIEITATLDIVERVNYDPYCYSHGTVCAGIISSQFNAGIELTSIKIINLENSRGKCEKLIAAIEWCVKNGIKIINLSLGTIRYSDFESINHAINFAAKSGLVIIAAGNNKGVLSYPAAHSKVIGVKCDLQNTLTEGQYIFNDSPIDGIEITVCSKAQLTNYLSELEDIEVCNSFAAPVITAKVCSILYKMPGIKIDEILELLRSQSINKPDRTYSFYEMDKLDWVERPRIYNLFSNMLKTCPKGRFSENTYLVKCNGLKDGLESIVSSIEAYDKTQEPYDDLVIINSDLFNNDYKTCYSNFINSLKPSGKNIILLDDYHNIEILFEEIKKLKVKYFNPFKTFDKLKDYDKKKINISIPIILLVDFGKKDLLHIVNGLCKLFKNDGYNTLTISDTMLGSLEGIHFFPLKDSYINNKPICPYIEEYMKVFDPEVLLIGINNENADQGYLSYIKEMVEPDANVYIELPVHYVSTDEYFDKPSFKVYSQLPKINKEEFFCSRKDNCVEGLYKSLLNLFDTQE